MAHCHSAAGIHLTHSQSMMFMHTSAHVIYSHVSGTCTQTYTHMCSRYTCTHAQCTFKIHSHTMHTYMHNCTHSHMHTHAKHTRTHACKYSHMYKCIALKHIMHTCVHIHMHATEHSYTHSFLCTHACTHSRLCTSTHICMCKR